MIRTGTFTLAMAAVAALALSSGHAAEMQAWNQPVAATAAKSFEQTVNEIYKSIKLEDGVNQARRNKTFLVAEDIRTLSRFSKRLAKQLASEASREETEPLFRRTLRLVNRLRTSMPGTPTFANEIDKIREARAQLDVLAPMYGITLPPPVAAPAKAD